MSNSVMRGIEASVIAPASATFAITPSDNATISPPARAIYVGSGGDIRLMALNDNSFVTFTNVASGSILDVRVKAISATGTTATNIVGLM